MEEDNKIPYFFLGLGVGIALGVLFAPKAGEETRGLILDKAGEGKEFLRRKTTDLKDSASDWIDKSKQAVSRQKEQFASAVQAGKQAYREATASGYPVAPPETDAAGEGV